jgi:hypothetical protein
MSSLFCCEDLVCEIAKYLGHYSRIYYLARITSNITRIISTHSGYIAACVSQDRISGWAEDIFDHNGEMIIICSMLGPITITIAENGLYSALHGRFA